MIELTAHPMVFAVAENFASVAVDRDRVMRAGQPLERKNCS